MAAPPEALLVGWGRGVVVVVTIRLGRRGARQITEEVFCDTQSSELATFERWEALSQVVVTDLALG
jgi:hypothetical protein